MSVTFVRKDAAFLGWSMHFLQVLAESPATYGATPQQVTAYTALHDAYATALLACEPMVRSRVSVVAKNAARAALETAARQTASIIKGQPGVTDAQQSLLGLNVRATPRRIAAPDSAPSIGILSVSNRTVRLRLREQGSSRRGKPAGVIGANLFTYVGEEPPSDRSAWTFHSGVGQTIVELTFPGSLPPGATVYVIACWFNGRKQSGPLCPPVCTHLQGGSPSMAA